MGIVVKETKKAMEETVEKLKNNLAKIRAGRANPAILDHIVVDYYGTPTPIHQLASVSVAENRILVIQPWDKGSLGDIEKALLKADLGIAPTNDGNVIRLTFPQPTEERRKEICKEVRGIGEDFKVAIRNIRRDANDEIKDMKDTMSEDDAERLEKDVQETTDRFIKEIDKIISEKEKEVLEI